MKSLLFNFSALAMLAMTKSLPCIGDSCGRLSPLHSDYDDDNGVFYIREGSHNSASSNDGNHEDNEEEDTFGVQSEPLYEQQHLQQQQRRPNRQRPSNNYQQGFGPNSYGQGSYQSNRLQQDDENQETVDIPNPRNNQGNYKRGNQGGNRGYQNNGAGSNGLYPGSGNQGGGGGRYHYNGAGYNGHYPGRNQGGGGGYNQNHGGSYGSYPDRQSSCPNCYATDFGNGEYNKNIINIEK